MTGFSNRDIQKAMMNDIEDALYTLKEQQNIALTTTEIDLVLEQVLEVARRRDRL